MSDGQPGLEVQKAPAKVTRVLVFLPSWLGDTVMATPTLRLLRTSLARSVIVGLGRPGMDDLLAGSDLLDDVVIADKRSVLGPAKIAVTLKRYRFDAALLLPNSFSSAMTVQLAGIPIRVGYDRDGRGLLLTHKLEAPRRPPPHKGWQPVSAVDYYLRAGRVLLTALGLSERGEGRSVPHLELDLTRGQERATDDILARAGFVPGEPFCLLNPGGNNPAKRWPVERFAAVAHHVIDRHRLKIAINGSPAEADMVRLIRDTLALHHPEDANMVACLPELGGTIGSLKGVVRRSRLMITNDTGPRHMAAAFDIPCVTLFGPTDPRWTTLPEADDRERETILVADPTLPADEVADEHPQRCRIEGIRTEWVIQAVDKSLAAGAGGQGIP